MNLLSSYPKWNNTTITIQKIKQKINKKKKSIFVSCYINLHAIQPDQQSTKQKRKEKKKQIIKEGEEEKKKKKKEEKGRKVMNKRTNEHEIETKDEWIYTKSKSYPSFHIHIAK